MHSEKQREKNSLDYPPSPIFGWGGGMRQYAPCSRTPSGMNPPLGTMALLVLPSDAGYQIYGINY